MTEKGWMTKEAFKDWFINLFLKEVIQQRPLVLLFDGHVSHISYELVKIARDDVYLMKLPPNTSLLQPLDVGVYGPTKTAWDKILVNFTRKNLGKAATKEIFPSLIKELWESGCMGEKNIREGY